MSDLQITISVALEPDALVATADKLNRLADLFNEPFEDTQITHDETTSNTGESAGTEETSDTTAEIATLSGVELDSLGLPWDERINTESKLKLKKEGTWKVKRGIDKALVENVRAELAAAMVATACEPETAATTAAPPPPAATTAAPPPPAANTVTKYITPDGGEYTADELLAAGWTIEQIHEREAVEVEITPETPAESAEAITFPAFMAKLSPATTAGTITDDQVNAALQKHGLASLVLLSARPDLIPVIDAELFGA
jgi:hypothetical protein